MSRPPALARALLRALLTPHEISRSLEGDLEEGFTKRAERSPTRARWWYRRQVLAVPYLALNRQIRSLQNPAVRRATTGWRRWGSVTLDLRITVRSLLRRPAFTGVAVATLALSIGAATLLFSVVRGVLLTPLPYENPDDLITIYLTNDQWRDSDNELLRRSWDSNQVSLRHVEAWRADDSPLTSVSGYSYRRQALETGSGPGDHTKGDVTAILVDRALFPTLGVLPALGRLPTDDDVRHAETVAVLRHQTWVTRFGADPEILGRSFRFGGASYTVIGVMPPEFFFPTETGADLWIPVPAIARDWPSFYGLGRLAPGATLEAANRYLETVARGLGEEDGKLAGFGARAVWHLDNVVGSVRGGIQLLFGTALLVVLVACVNLGNLFLARTENRRRELAIRSSLGAGARSLAATVLAEALVVGAVGGGLGVALAAGLLDPFVAALGTSLRDLPRQGAVGIDGAVVTFSIAATLLTTLVAGLFPIVSSLRRFSAVAVRGMGRSPGNDRTRLGQRALLGIQAALTLVLVTGAALLGRSFLEAMRVDLGMEIENVAFLDVDLDTGNDADTDDLNASDGIESEAEREAESRARRAALGELRERLRARLAALPGVSEASTSSSLPGQGGVLLFPLRAEEAASEDAATETPVLTVSVGQDYFSTLGIPMLAGREIARGSGTSDPREAVLSESLALSLFGRRDVIGRRLLLGSNDPPEPLEVVGVAGETRQLSVFQPPAPILYLPIAGTSTPNFNLLFSTRGARPASLLDEARAAALEIDPTLEVNEASAFGPALRAGMRHLRLRMTLMAALAALAGLLALIGIAGVVAHFLSEQTHEVGVRMALGSGGRREITRVVQFALKPTLLGLTGGLLVALASSSVMQGFLFGVEPTDPLTYTTVAVALLVTAGVAAWIPARRAAAVDPARVLGRES